MTPFWLRFATYLGADPYRAPAVLHNIAWVELGYGVWHLRGGLLDLARTLHAQAEALGVRFEFGTRVTSLSAHGGLILGAHTSQGAFAADAWVSAADRALTLSWLGSAEKPTPRGVSGFALQLQLSEDRGRRTTSSGPPSTPASGGTSAPGTSRATRRCTCTWTARGRSCS